MAMVVLSSLMKVVCEKLASQGLKELNLLTRVDKELRKLESTMKTIQDVLEEAEARQVKEKVLKGWLTKLKDLAFEADDVLDEFLASKAAKSKVSSLLSLVSRFKIAHKIKEIRERLDEVSEERFKFHLREGAAVKTWKEEEEIGDRETGSFVIESEVYGRDEDKEKIVEFLVSIQSDVNVNVDPDVVSIVGFGGLGKTTLAQLVYNDDRTCKHFEQRIWVCVSNEFDNRKLIRSIIETITGRECQLKHMNSLQLCLREHLSGKRFLLVLDDVWNENHEKWDKLRILLTGFGKGSRVIVTTRSERVASIMSTVSPYFLDCLSDEHCLALFEKRAFGLSGCEKSSSLVAIGMEIVSKCGGVPLAAKALGSLMSFRKEESEWLAVRDNEIWEFSPNEIMPALMLSYNHLPAKLKPCFSYCSMFPKNYEVRKEKLVHLWMGEGFIGSEKVGFHYVDELLSRSLFQNGGKDLDGVVRQVKMHDLVHDLARFVAGEECSVVDAGTGEGLLRSSRYASFACDGSIPEVMLQPLREAKRLRTLYLVAPKFMKDEQDKLPELLPSMFSSLQLLRALHLRHLPMRELPVSVRKMKHLRYLDLSDTQLVTLPSYISLLPNLQTLILSCCKKLRVLPESIGELYNLTTLDVHFCSSLTSLPNSIGCLKKLQKLDLSIIDSLQELPESLSCLSNLQVLNLRYCESLHELPLNMKNLTNLRYLDITSCHGLNCMPEGIGQLTNLQILPLFVPGGRSKCSIRELGALDLHGTLSIRKLENVKDADEAKKANMIKKQSLKTLCLSWNVNAYRNPRQACDEDNVDVLESLQPNTSLEVLNIEGYMARGFPNWMMNLCFPNLVEIKLTSCLRCESLPAFGQLPHLKVLKLSSLNAIRYLDSTIYDSINVAFPTLVELELATMLQLEKWLERSQNSGELFPSLAKLSLKACPALRTMPSAFPTVAHLSMDVNDELLISALHKGAFPNLKHLDVSGCIGNDEEEYMKNLPEVLTERMRSIESWLVSAKVTANDESSSVMSVTCSGSWSFPVGMHQVLHVFRL